MSCSKQTWLKSQATYCPGSSGLKFAKLTFVNAERVMFCLCWILGSSSPADTHIKS